MGYTKYNLPDGRYFSVIQCAVIGEPQQSLIQYIREQIEKGEEFGNLVEGRWFVEPTVEKLGEQISAIVNQNKRVQITIHGDESLSTTEIVIDVINLLKSYGLYKYKLKE